MRVREARVPCRRYGGPTKTALLVAGVPSSRGWEVVRGASVVYLAFVGLVFNTLLVGADLGELVPWVNVVHPW